MAAKAKKSILYIILILLAVICLMPFALMMVNATRSGSEIVHSFTLIPSNALAQNWETVSGYFDLFKGILNSLIVSVPATLLSSYFSAMAAYGLVMYKFKGNKFISGVIIIFMMIPGQLSMIGFYDLITKMHMIDTYWPLILPAIAAPGTVFFLRQYCEGALQPALIEAARMDGAKEIYIFHKIILPHHVTRHSYYGDRCFHRKLEQLPDTPYLTEHTGKIYASCHDRIPECIHGYHGKPGSHLSGGCYFRDPDSHCVRILFQIHHRQYISRRCQRVGTVI